MAPESLILSDGRRLDYFLSGAKDGFPLVFLHGTPGAYLAYPGLSHACANKGLKLITPTRPGYGGSSRKQGRVVMDFVADVQALLDNLGHEKCFVGGTSGGGPHAIACAARLPGCQAALVIAGGGPAHAEDLDYLAGQGEDNIKEWEALQKGESHLRDLCNDEREQMLQADAKGLVEVMSTILPPVDKKAMLEHDDLGQFMVDSLREGLKFSVDGWVDDNLELLQPWGFELSDVQIPVHIWQGSEDKMVPIGHGKWYASHLPQEKVRPHLLEGEGHISVYVGHMDEMLDGLMDEHHESVK